MSYDTAIQVLKAAAEPTRFRLLNMLSSGEATVGELQTVLQQSQPRVSRHLRLLGEAGLVDHFRDGQWRYYRLDAAPAKATQISSLLQLAGDDPTIERDLHALNLLKRARENEALRPPSAINRIRRHLGEGRPDETQLLGATDELLAEQRFADALLIGCGNATLLELIAPVASRVVAIDDSRSARLIARSRVHQSGFTHLTVRNEHPAEISYADGAFDLVVLNEVIAGGRNPRDVLAEASRVLGQGGRLLIFDRVSPAATRLPGQAHRGALVENQLSAWLRELGCQVAHRHWFAGRVLEYALFMAVKNHSG